MGITCGIVGLPNVGKSTLFNCLTKAGVDAANYPFCTIEPNVGVVSVPDNRLNTLAAIVTPEKVLPATMEFVDIAGLVKGASLGEGLGNRFLANIRETNAIAHVVRCFENSDIAHVSGKINPIDDIEIIQTELALADLESATKITQRLQKQAKSGDKTAKTEINILERAKKHLDLGLPIRTLNKTDDESKILLQYQFLTHKPVLYVANVAEDGFQQNPHLEAVKKLANTEDANVVAVCAAIEAEIAELSDTEKKEFLTDLGVEEPGLDRVIHASYKLLQLDTYFTAGVKEVRAWTIKHNSTAPAAAGVIHTDFEKGFIRAEVISYTDYINYTGENGAKEAGKWRLEGKDYIVQDGDVMHFRFNV